MSKFRLGDRVKVVNCNTKHGLGDFESILKGKVGMITSINDTEDVYKYTVSVGMYEDQFGDHNLELVEVDEPGMLKLPNEAAVAGQFVTRNRKQIESEIAALQKELENLPVERKWVGYADLVAPDKDGRFCVSALGIHSLSSSLDFGMRKVEITLKEIE